MPRFQNSLRHTDWSVDLFYELWQLRDLTEFKKVVLKNYPSENEEAKSILKLKFHSSSREKLFHLNDKRPLWVLDDLNYCLRKENWSRRTLR